jgi:hypothetical protein
MAELTYAVPPNLHQVGAKSERGRRFSFRQMTDSQFLAQHRRVHDAGKMRLRVREIGARLCRKTASAAANAFKKRDGGVAARSCYARGVHAMSHKLAE